MLGLNIENRQVVGQVVKEALLEMTQRQLTCFVLSLIGLKQSDMGWVLGISQQSAGEHLRKSMEKVREISDNYL